MRKLEEQLLMVEAVLDLAKVLEVRRATLAAGQGIGDIDDDPAYKRWQRTYGRLGARIKVEDEAIRYATMDEGVKLTQALLEAAHKHFGVPRDALLQHAREDGPPSNYPLITPVSR